MDFTTKQQTAPRLLPMRLQRAEMQQHERAGGFAHRGRPAKGGLEEICELCGNFVSEMNIGDSHADHGTMLIGKSYMLGEERANIPCCFDTEHGLRHSRNHRRGRLARR